MSGSVILFKSLLCVREPFMETGLSLPRMDEKIYGRKGND